MSTAPQYVVRIRFPVDGRVRFLGPSGMVTYRILATRFTGRQAADTLAELSEQHGDCEISVLPVRDPLDSIRRRIR